MIGHRIQPSVPTRSPGLLSETHSPEVVQAWFQGMNPLLGDLAPARLLRDSESDESAHRVLTAARDFAASA